MATASSEAATTDDAHALVVQSVARLRRHGVACVLASSRSTGSLHRLYDTLVLRVERDRPLENPHASRAIRNDTTTPASTVIREALLLWRRISRRKGLSLCANTAFWISAFGGQPATTTATATTTTTVPHPLVVPAARVAFPRVVIHWDFRTHGGDHYRYVSMDTELALLHERVLDVFLKPLADHEMDGHASDDDHAPIDCAVRIRFRRQHTMSEQLFMHVAAQATAYEASRSKPAALVWTGIEVLARHYHERRGQGLDASQLLLLTDFLPEVPLSMPIDLQLTHRTWRWMPARQWTTQVPPRTLVAFLHEAYGFTPTHTMGRLKVLDLIHAFKSQKNDTGSLIDVASVCSLLPSMNSLEELRVEITNQQQLVWLAYAIFHPRSIHTKWRTLVIHVAATSRASIDWSAWITLFHSSSRLLTLQYLLQETEVDVRTDEAPATALVWTTATVAKCTKLYASSDKSNPRVALRAGDRVEVCDVNVSDDTKSMIAVIVPGHGLGWIARCVLSRIRRMDFADRPRSSITSLTIDDPAISTADQDHVLRLLGSSLLHLRTTGPSWFERSSLCTLLPLVESINNCQFTPAIVHSDVHLLPKLRTLHVSCPVDSIATCATWLTPRRHFPALWELLLRIDVDNQNETPTFPSATVSSIFVGKQTLRWATVLLTHDRITSEIRHKTTTSDGEHVSDRKVAFLSVVHHVDTQPAAVTSLDASVLRIVFDFLGPSMEHECVGAMPAQELGALLTSNASEMPSDAWYDA